MLKPIKITLWAVILLTPISAFSKIDFFVICTNALGKISQIINFKNKKAILELADADREVIKVVPFNDPKNPFSHANYEASNYGISSGHKHNDDYVNRAVKTAHKVLNSLNNGASMEEAYHIAVEGRLVLDKGLDPGVRFRKSSQAPLDKLATTASNVMDIPYRNKLYEHVNGIFKLRKTSENVYTLSDGRKMELATITHNAIGNANDINDTFLRNGRSLEDINEAFKDVFKRLDRAATSQSTESKIDDFSHALYGLANTSPLYRGNSSVARDFMTAAAFRIFGKSFKLYADITLEAMYREEDQFLALLKPKIKEALNQATLKPGK